MKLEGWFGLYHIIYIILSLGIIAGVLILIKKKVKNEKILDIILRSIAGLLIVLMIINRITATEYRINVAKTVESWWGVLPDTICSLTSISLAVAVLINCKKNNLAFHYLVYISVIGCVITTFYPDFLITQPFHLTCTYTGLLHHSISLLLSLILITNNRFEPDTKKWYVAPIGYSFYIVYGEFCISAFGLKKSMGINNPLISSLPILTSWYIVGIAFSALIIGFSFLYEKVLVKKFKKNKEENELEKIKNNSDSK